MSWGPLAMTASVGSVRACDVSVEVARVQVLGRLSHGQCGWRDRAAGITAKASTLRHEQTPPLLQAASAASGEPPSDFFVGSVGGRGVKGFRACTPPRRACEAGAAGGREAPAYLYQ